LLLTTSRICGVSGFMGSAPLRQRKKPRKGRGFLTDGG